MKVGLSEPDTPSKGGNKRYTQSRSDIFSMNTLYGFLLALHTFRIHSGLLPLFYAAEIDASL